MNWFKRLFAKSTRSSESSAELRKAIWDQVSRTPASPPNVEFLNGLGDSAVQPIIDIFCHPRDATTGVACNQGILACILSTLATRGNKEAAAFLVRVANNEIVVFDADGQGAWEIAKEYVSARVSCNGSNAIQKKQESQMPPPAPSAAYSYDDAIARAREDSAASRYPSEKIGMEDLAVQLAKIRSGTHDINAKDRNGWIALRAAVRFGHTETVKLLISNGADVNATYGLKNITALMAAVQRGHLEMVELLLSKGADVNAKEALTGRTVFMMGDQIPEMKELLKRHGAQE